MRKIIAVLVAALLCFTSFAQEGKARTAFGFKAGVNLSTFRPAVDYDNFDPRWKGSLK